MTDEAQSTSPNLDVDVLAEGAMFGAYSITRMIGVGGMGQVYEAEHVGLSKRVALKVIVPQHASNPEIVERFLLEARATARVRHPNVVDVTDVGTINGVPYLVMEYLEGEPLTQHIYQKGHLQVAEAIDLILPVLSAMDAVHAQSIVHRDLKPDNVFLVRAPGKPIRPVILDFGISKLMENSALAAPRLTRTTSIIGTPYYIAPEQAQDSRNVDARTDVYSTAVVLYEMLAGTVPFSADTLMSLLMQVAKGEYLPLHARSRQIDIVLSYIVAKAMAVNAQHRFASANDFARALLPFASDEMRARYDKELRPAPPLELPPDVRAYIAAQTNPLATAPTDPPPPIAKNEKNEVRDAIRSPAAPLGTGASQLKRTSAKRNAAAAADEKNTVMVIGVIAAAAVFLLAGIGAMIYAGNSAEPATAHTRRHRTRTQDDDANEVRHEIAVPQQQAVQPEPAIVANTPEKAPNSHGTGATQARETRASHAAVAAPAPTQAVPAPRSPTSAAALAFTSQSAQARPQPNARNAATQAQAQTAPQTQPPQSGWGAQASNWGAQRDGWSNAAAAAAVAAPAQAPAAPARAPNSPHAQAHLRFSGCGASFDGDLAVNASAAGVRVTSTSVSTGRPTASMLVSVCRATGRYELGTSDAARYGVNVVLEQGGRSWSVQSNAHVSFNDELSGGHITVNRTHCGQGVLDVRFDDAVLVSANRRSTCTVNGTLRTTGADR